MFLGSLLPPTWGPTTLGFNGKGLVGETTSCSGMTERKCPNLSETLLFLSVLLLREEILCDVNPKKCPHLDEHVPFPDINC